MRCRALGLAIEDAFLANLSRQLAVAQWTVVQGKLIPTEANAARQEVYRRNGFTQLRGEPGVWSRSLLTAFEVSRHVAITTTFGQKLSAPLQTAEDK
jgi:predicted enzyme involved in methoxymalonyl-ACP biosynthesis